MTYEAWRISYQSSEQAARAAYAEFDDLRTKLEATEEDRSRFLLEMGRLCAQCDALRAKLEAAEKKHDDVARQLVQSEITRREISEAHSAVTRRLSVLADENTTLRAKIAEMEQQEPVGKFVQHPSNGLWEQDGYGDNPDASPLYALPGAQAQNVPKAVAYLDLGTGGYMDIGTDLTDEALAALPKGRHMLGIVGTYGVDGYVPVEPTPSVPTALLVAAANLVAQVEIVRRVGFVDTPNDKDSCAAFCVAEGTWLELMSAIESLASALAAGPEVKS